MTGRADELPRPAAPIGPIPRWLNRILSVELTVFEFVGFLILALGALAATRLTWTGWRAMYRARALSRKDPK
ncbi:hypothetical protein [Nocardia goodfellowii]|uniref:Uncharacterized protein n=1 Tax=Nocardia goodfellowii TaxID=882446 RepID=A0ABS4QMX3_9NOCA|nr:hypothetical protein [Nocardia goodfellowii]MBP2193057.1 hypothetical protein [Nocardia goodfellowii]